MIPSKFDYIRADSVSEAIKLLGRYDDAKLLAGGHSLIPSIKLRLNQPEILIDIGGISALQDIAEFDDSIIVGANCTHARIAASTLLARHTPALAQAAAAIGDVQVRNAGTIGGSIAHADPAADYPAVVMAHDATVLVEGASGKREIRPADLFIGLFETSVADNEVITGIRFPKSASGTYLKFANAASRYAVVGCAAVRTASGIQVGITGVSETAYRAKAVEEAFKGSDAAAAATHAVDGVEVLSDHYASADYRSHLARVYVRKALQAA